MADEQTPGPADGKVDEVLARVEAGEVTAVEALKAERAKDDDARSTLVEKLVQLAEAIPPPDPGPAPAAEPRVLVTNTEVDGVWYGPSYNNAHLVPADVAERITNPACWAD